MCHNEKGVRYQACDHDDQSITRQRHCTSSQSFPPIDVQETQASASPSIIALLDKILISSLFLVVVLLQKALVLRGVWTADFPKEESRQDEADTRAACAPNVRKHLLEGSNGHGDEVAEDDNHSGYSGKTGLRYVSISPGSAMAGAMAARIPKQWSCA